MPPPTAETCRSTAMTALDRGDFPSAAHWFEPAARVSRAEGAAAQARVALTNLASVRRILGGHREALEALDEAVTLFTPDMTPEDRGMVLLVRGGVLDLLRDPRALGAWTDAASTFAAQPMLALVCRAHAAGAALAMGVVDALPSARRVITALGPGGTPALIAGVIGAVGDSAAAAGVPFLAQAVWLMLRHPAACNPSNAPYFPRFAERVGAGDPICMTVCALALQRAGALEGTPEHGGVMGHAVDLFHAVAAARGITPEAMLEQVSRAGAAVPTLDEGLRALVPAGQWLVPKGM